MHLISHFIFMVNNNTINLQVAFIIILFVGLNEYYAIHVTSITFVNKILKISSIFIMLKLFSFHVYSPWKVVFFNFYSRTLLFYSIFLKVPILLWKNCVWKIRINFPRDYFSLIDIEDLLKLLQ